jgi:hypothetical protein
MRRESLFHRTPVPLEAARKPRQAGIANKPDMAVAQTDQISSRILAALNIIGKDHIAILQILLLTDHVIAENRKRDAFVGKQLDEIRRVRARQDDRSDHIVTLHHFRQVQLCPGNVGRIIVRE